MGMTQEEMDMKKKLTETSPEATTEEKKEETDGE